MSDQAREPDVGQGRDETQEERRRRLAAVFGDVLPDTTSDERDDFGDRRGDDDATERWLKAQVPPHHG